MNQQSINIKYAHVLNIREWGKKQLIDKLPSKLIKLIYVYNLCIVYGFFFSSWNTSPFAPRLARALIWFQISNDLRILFISVWQFWKLLMRCRTIQATNHKLSEILCTLSIMNDRALIFSYRMFFNWNHTTAGAYEFLEFLSSRQLFSTPFIIFWHFVVFIALGTIFNSNNSNQANALANLHLYSNESGIYKSARSWVFW